MLCMPDPEFCLPWGLQRGMCIQLSQSRRIALPLLEQNPRRYIISQTGTVNFDTTRSRVGTHSRLALLLYVDAMEMMYPSADVVVARAGAITCSELLVTATPPILETTQSGRGC